jgi:zinc transport system substrate-binding protein
MQWPWLWWLQALASVYMVIPQVTEVKSTESNMLHYNLSSHSVGGYWIMKLRFLQLGVALATLIFACASQAKPLVLSSIKPLTLIAQEIVGTNADVDTLLPATASHHDYPLKASDYARLQKADVILWVGPELESFLQKPTANLPAAKIITAYDLTGIHWPIETAIAHDDHHHAQDPHLWLDPRNAVVVAEAVTAKLTQIDAVNAKQYQTNLQLFSVKMQQLDEKLQLALKPVSGVGFAVYHEGFAHFVSHYGLHQLDYVALTPEQKPGAKHMHQLRERLAKEGKCLFLEPYNDMQSTRNLAQELHLQIGTLDALGAQGATTYVQLLEQMAVAFSACLTDRRN